MNSVFRCVLAYALALAVSAAAFGGVEVRLKNGSRWRGELNDYVQLSLTQNGLQVQFEGHVTAVRDLYIKVEGEVAGRVGEKTIFKADILSMKTVENESEVMAAATAAKPSRAGMDAAGERELGVFVLPLGGMVGEGFRADEIRKIGEHADTFGDGQIIVLIVDSHGGLASVMEDIHGSIVDLKKRHRVVAWIRTAISAAAAASLACDEIYFTTEGTLGAMTAYAGQTALQGEELQTWIRTARQFARNGGRDPVIAEAMIIHRALLSYDVDEETGDVTWYDTLEGEHVLSTTHQNLVFTASTATHSGFADGIADREDELAKLLKLPYWHEIDDYGREMAEDWIDTVDTAKKEIPRLIARRGYWKSSGSAVERIGALIQIDKELIRWINKAPDVTRLMGLSKRPLEREIEELRKQLADMKRRR